MQRTDPPRQWGLRARLSLSIAAIVALVGAGMFVAIYRGTGSQLRDQIDRELRAEVGSFAHAGLTRSSSPGVAAITRVVSDYIRGRPFGAQARLLVARVPRGPIITNEPELLGLSAPGQLSREHETPRVRSQEDEEAADLRAAPSGYSEVQLHDAGRLRVLTENVSSGGGPQISFSAGEPLASVQQAQDGVARTFALAGSVTLLLALLAGYLLAARTTGPLRRVAAAAAAVSAGDLSHRTGQAGRRDEVGVVAAAFDQMLDRLQEVFARQRSFVADASHELRTPLTVIGGQIEVLARGDEPSSAEITHVAGIVRTEIARMERLVDDLLLLASADERRGLELERFELEPFIEELYAGIRESGDRRFQCSRVPRGTITADPDRLAQILRNLARNAVEHTRPGGVVRLDVSVAADGVTFAIEDDGPGIAPAERKRVFDRFHRADSSRARSAGGTGLGLAIAQALVQAHGGTIWVTQAPAGGARVAFTIPGFHPHQ